MGWKRMDLLEQLAEARVPPVPQAKRFNDGVRRKLHPRLLALHIVEFAFGATGWAAMHLCVALCASLHFTVTGKWLEKSDTSQG